MDKMNLLFNLIENKKTVGCTILGVPSVELRECIIRNKDVMSLFKEKNIEIPFEIAPDGLEHTYINVYVPRAYNSNKTIYSISISEKVDINIELVQAIINNFFVEIVDLYQYDLTPYHIDLILNDEKISFKDILMYINRNTQQKELANKINVSQQLITELKNDRTNMSIETLSSLVKEYPLLFWHEYLISK